MRYKECKLSSCRRSSNASRDGSLRANMAKADIKISVNGITPFPRRGSATRAKLEWTKPTKASAERCFRADRPAMANSWDPKIAQLRDSQRDTFTKHHYTCPAAGGVSGAAGNCCSDT